MSNTQAPYKNPATLQMLQDWWDTQTNISPIPTASLQTIYDLYLAYDLASGQLIWSPNYLTASQFAKCITALSIANVDGTFVQLPDWQPKAYEIARAKVC
jgi:hypothetical protein